MLSNLILSLAISFAVGLNGITKNENNNFNNDINVNNVNHTINYKVDTSESSSEITYPIYDDVNEAVTFSVYQVNNYSFTNFANVLLEHNLNYFDGNQINYGHGTYFLDDFDTANSLIYVYDDDSNTYRIKIYVTSDVDFGKFFYSYWDEEQQEYIYQPFQYNLTYDLNSQMWEDGLTAIQADIQANEQTGTMGDNIIEAITSGLGLIRDLAREFLTGFGTLFWDATANNNAGALTPFGQFALVMLGVTITMAVISLVLALIKGNTGA